MQLHKGSHQLLYVLFRCEPSASITIDLYQGQCTQSWLIPEILIPRFTISPINSLVSLRISFSVRPAQGTHCTEGFVSRLSLATMNTKACVAALRLYQNIAFSIFLRDSLNEDSLEGTFDSMMSYSGREIESDKLLSSDINLRHCFFQLLNIPS